MLMIGTDQWLIMGLVHKLRTQAYPYCWFVSLITVAIRGWLVSITIYGQVHDHENWTWLMKQWPTTNPGYLLAWQQDQTHQNGPLHKTAHFCGTPLVDNPMFTICSLVLNNLSLFLYRGDDLAPYVRGMQVLSPGPGNLNQSNITPASEKSFHHGSVG